ncbi:stage II sporulation protein P [Sporolituus thermophilus]|uniref:Stage II sporulation protein P n=1 Tax=Sporolituus thermophilus DSM 23256 TaxID=1123285 RepID=A0A1G7NLP7_9FIRM|nr:stage II sporulation protein P [Sporolituus thermophilus]SDF74933.1 stage II sporulation protein P [Sporolituus thermophilus DSM 23256]
MSRRRRYHSKIKPLYITLCVATLFLVIAAGYWTFHAAALPVSTSAGTETPKWREIFFASIPGISKTAQPVKVAVELTPQTFLGRIVLFLTNIDIGDSKSLLRMEIPLLAAVKSSTPMVSAKSLPNFPKFDPQTFLLPGKPLVGIYHTHTSESFVPSSGVTHKRGGQTGDIVDVGRALAARLDKHGIKAVHSTAVHDYPSFMKAYGPSENTVKKMLADHPSIQMIFDIHRDADKRENSVAEINGVTLARITIVVATGQQDLVQPHWQQNHAFAKLIDAKLNQHFPGLSRGIQLVDWRYNQHLHPRALLIEVGCQDNSKEEAMRSIELFGDVLAEIIAENNN